MIFQRANNLNRKIYCSDPRCAKISGCFFFARRRGIVNFLKFQSPRLASNKGDWRKDFVLQKALRGEWQTREWATAGGHSPLKAPPSE
ncbi:MAG: hypothetical protein CRN43_15550 [Candidatus Nephrothrix sp. EaCA]|nr:MAG: hypothetical protein CRN43_15550 [Candidatus Nephrothrix sp. EaCA]